jgi:hypothetical protein
LPATPPVDAIDPLPLFVPPFPADGASPMKYGVLLVHVTLIVLLPAELVAVEATLPTLTLDPAPAVTAHDF